jgi:WD40 repeat protein
MPEDSLTDWFPTTLEICQLIGSPKSQVNCAAWSLDGRLLAIGADDGTIHVWDTLIGLLIHILKGHGGPVRCVTWSPMSPILSSASDDRTLRVWDIATGAMLRRVRGHRFPVRHVAWSPDGQFLASGSADGTVVWNAATGTPLGFKISQSVFL